MRQGESTVQSIQIQIKNLNNAYILGMSWGWNYKCDKPLILGLLLLCSLIGLVYCSLSTVYSNIMYIVVHCNKFKLIHFIREIKKIYKLRIPLTFCRIS